MANNFFEGIDWIADPTGGTFLTSRRGISKSGNDANTGTDPNNPKLTLASASTINAVWIIGTGKYNISGNLLWNKNLLGDGRVEIVGDGSGTFGADTSTDFGMRDLIVRNFATVNISGGDTGLSVNCIVANISSSWNIHRDNVTYAIGINCNSVIVKSLVLRSSFFNSPITFVGNNGALTDCYIHSDSKITCTNAIASDKINNCIIRGQVRVDGVDYDNIQDARDTLADQSLFPDCTMDDPLFNGDPFKYQFSVAMNSPALLAGTGGLNIGGLASGVVQNSTTDEFGTSPASNTNTEFVSDELRVVSPAIEGRRESDWIDLGNEYKSPKFTLSALLDFVNNTPDANNALTNPNNLVFEAQWKDRTGNIHATWEKFKVGMRMYYDDVNDKYTGEAGFSGAYINEIVIKEIKIALEPRNDYIEA